jgi:2-keto-3-deoxy-L-rhamnonate aldolase RhmA
MDVRFRERIRSGERLIGTLVTLAAPEVAELMRLVGFDWLFLDGEHTPLEAGSFQRLLQAAGPDLPCLVRIPEAGETPVKKALDIGAAGIVVPMVNSAEEAERVVRLARYHPLGTRGVGLGRAHGYGLRFREYLDGANQGVSVVIQAEHIRAVESMEAVVRVEGVDAVLVGPYDLSASLGRQGEVDHPDVAAAVDRVTSVCRAAGMPLGVFGIDAPAVRPYVEKGYSLLVSGVDTLLLGDAARRLLEELRSGR